MSEKKGLSGQHHSDLNRPEISYPGGKEARTARIAQLHQEYAGDSKAQQQINVYEGGNEYSRRISEYVEAMKSGDLAKQKELEKWFHTNYPDI